jgi:hypothetical protein
MKGIVFVKFVEMVESAFSVDMAGRMVEESQLPSGGVYTAVGTYDHHELKTMLGVLSRLTREPPEALLRRYGRFLFGEFFRLYPGVFEGIGSSMDFVAGVESVIHVEVRKLYPDAELPSFEVIEHTPDRLEIIYRSERHLAELARGLIEACIDHFNDGIDLEQSPVDGAGDPVRFVLARRQ